MNRFHSAAHFASWAFRSLGRPPRERLRVAPVATYAVTKALDA